jgi:hypothetical protein
MWDAGGNRIYFPKTRSVLMGVVTYGKCVACERCWVRAGANQPKMP